MRDGHCVGATMREKPDAKEKSAQRVGQEPQLNMPQSTSKATTTGQTTLDSEQ